MAFDRFRGPQAAHLHPNSPGFGSANASSIERAFVAAGRQLRDRLANELDDLAAGRTNPTRFLGRATRAVRDAYFVAYSLGASSVFPFYTLTDRDIAVLDDELTNERTFLRAFARQIERGFLVLDPWARGRLYVLALRGIFERGRVEAMPPGPYRWRLGITEHCGECLQASLAGPYQRDRFSGLGLSALPGTPGDGSVCLGVTRCGCTIELTSGPVPGSELTDTLRARLLEIVNERSGINPTGTRSD